MRLKSLEISGFKSFAKKTTLGFDVPVTGIVGPNGSGKSNVAEAFRFVLGEQSVKSLRGKKGEDLIFGGGKSLARQNRAGVKVVFDNTGKRLPIDFEEVSLERIVNRDGFNEYFINGSRSRLKDVVELLAHANIGSSGHHIISQGEADRILSASPIERREMVEDALGLKIYHYRKKETERKLEKTEENIKQVESLRREIAPHLSFLRKQVEKLEKSRELKEKLGGLFLDYFKREALYISFTKSALAAEKKEPETALKNLEKELKKTEEILEHVLKHSSEDKHLKESEQTLVTLRAEKDELSRDIGRIEGELTFIARARAKEAPAAGTPSIVSYHDVKKLTDDIDEALQKASLEKDLTAAISHIQSAQEKIKSFFERVKKSASSGERQDEYEKDLHELSLKKDSVNTRIGALAEEIAEAMKKTEETRSSIEANKEGEREAERSLYEIKAKQNETIAVLSEIRLREEKVEEIETKFKKELGEAGAIVGERIVDYGAYDLVDEHGSKLVDEAVVSEDRGTQEERARSIERFKIRLEESGLATGEDVLKEYKETSERDEFLKKEVEDLHGASGSLATLIAELDAELKKRFDTGIVKINDSFEKFFSTMFGGGEARLDVVIIKKRGAASADGEDGEIEDEADLDKSGDDSQEQTGIDVHVSLPHKRIKGLTMLSGGERALTSIALLFALSQVNPPPFIVLDETDAALDEANSRKYGNMIESLAKRSQLILITHNRETMSRAGVLYGVTMSAEGYSTLLSIRFEDAVKVAK